ncbi:TPA: hypothetical protein ACE8IK_002196, partial [Neisseria gonorrhoeae]
PLAAAFSIAFLISRLSFFDRRFLSCFFIFFLSGKLRMTSASIRLYQLTSDPTGFFIWVGFDSFCINSLKNQQFDNAGFFARRYRFY